jgi:hypothetical protein
MRRAPLFSAATCLAAALLSFGPAALAADQLTLAEAQQLALQRSRQVVAQDAAVTAAREMAVAAGQLPDPILKAGVDNVPASGADRGSLSADFMTMRRIGFSQEITRGEKRATNRKPRKIWPIKRRQSRPSSATRRWLGWSSITLKRRQP